MLRPCSVCKEPCDATDEKGVVICANCIRKSFIRRKVLND
jgi:hypothetical protein